MDKKVAKRLKYGFRDFCIYIVLWVFIMFDQRCCVAIENNGEV